MEGQRIQWLDAMRAFAALTVILCHCVENIYRLTPEVMVHFSLRSVVFAFASFTLGRIGVPLFLFITGYLLLDRTGTIPAAFTFGSFDGYRCCCAAKRGFLSTRRS